MTRATWIQLPDNPKHLTLALPALGSYQLLATEAINQLATSANRTVRLHLEAATFELDFSDLKPAFRQKPGVARKGEPALPVGEVCSIEQNGQWLSPDGWQPERRYLRLQRAGVPVVEPPPPPPKEKVAKHKVCKNVRPNGAVCNTANFLDARVCRECGCDNRFETVYE